MPNLKQEELQRLRVRSNEEQEYYLFVPEGSTRDTKVFVTVHGISRNVLEHASLYLPFAKQQNVILIAPYFPQNGYQQPQRLDSEFRSDKAFESILMDVEERANVNTNQIYLFGYSGGGQFVHRYMMAYPQKVARLAVGAAGWYTFPDPGYDYPQGITINGSLDLSLVPTDFLQVPTLVVVGDKDTDRGSSLHKEPSVDEQQGLTRVERGRRWLKAMEEEARARGLETEYQFTELEGVIHNFGQCMRKANMGKTVFDFLFGSN